MVYYFGKNTIVSRPSQNTGFIALFFVLTVSSFLTILIFGLSRSFTYTLTMLDRYRNQDNSRSAALYCKYKIFNNILTNIEYVPVLHVNIPTPRDTVCRYESYKRISPNAVEVTIVGERLGGASTDHHSGINDSEDRGLKNHFEFTYSFTITNDYFNYIKSLE